MISYYDPTSSGRYKRKFVIRDYLKAEVKAKVLLHPAMFREKYGARMVNNIYFDSPEYANFLTMSKETHGVIKFASVGMAVWKAK